MSLSGPGVPRAAEPLEPRPGTGWVFGYFVAYLGYLVWSLEGELTRWLTLVGIPFLGLWWIGRRVDPDLRPRQVARRIGLRWPERGRGLGLALTLALSVQVVQLMNRHQRDDLLTVLSSEAAIWVVPTAFLLVLVTASFTEEFFFRGIFQRAVTGRTGSVAIGIAAASVAFSLYHLPYAYLDASWPSAGDLGRAVPAAFVNGMLGGIVLGIVFVRSGLSLVPCMLLHAAIDWIPAIRLLGAGSGAELSG